MGFFQRFAVMVWLGILFGCSKGPAFSPLDQEAMDDLKKYNPKPEFDDHGRVRALALEGEQVDAGALAAVSKLTEIRWLSLYGTRVTDDSLTQLIRLKWLEGLGLGGTLVTDAGMDHLEKMKRLRFLWLKKGQISEERAEALKKRCVT